MVWLIIYIVNLRVLIFISTAHGCAIDRLLVVHCADVYVTAASHMFSSTGARRMASRVVGWVERESEPPGELFIRRPFYKADSQRQRSAL